MASPKVDDATVARVTEKLTAEGYQVRKVGSEDGMIEVYALRDGHKIEMYLDADLNVVKSKTED